MVQKPLFAVMLYYEKSMRAKILNVIISYNINGIIYNEIKCIYSLVCVDN